jgi:hypothetical protein
MYYIIADSHHHFENCLREKGIKREDAKYIYAGTYLMGREIKKDDSVIVYGPQAQRFWEIFQQVQMRRVR